MTSNSVSKFFLALVCTVFISAGASAGPFVIDVANDGATTSNGYTTLATTVGQSFVAGANVLDHVELQVNAQSTTLSTTVHVDILTAVGGSLLGSSQSLVISGTAIQLAHFEFATGVALTSGTTYFLQFVQDAGTLAGAFVVGTFGTDSYAGGAAYSDGPCCNGFQGDDLWFRIGHTVSEPGVLGFMGLALFALGWRRRRLGNA